MLVVVTWGPAALIIVLLFWFARKLVPVAERTADKFVASQEKMASSMEQLAGTVREQRSTGYAEHREVMLEIQCLQGDITDTRKSVDQLNNTLTRRDRP